MEKIFFRVHHPKGLGLWYNEQGEFTNEISKLELQCAGLEMNKNEECEGGFLSCTDSMESLLGWFGREELLKLKDKGYDICVFKADEYKFHDKYKHFLFKQQGSLLIAHINIF